MTPIELMRSCQDHRDRLEKLRNLEADPVIWDRYQKQYEIFEQMALIMEEARRKEESGYPTIWDRLNTEDQDVAE